MRSPACSTRFAKFTRILALALLRFSITSHGSIFIDGRNIKDTNLHALRSRVTLIPQDATLFEGTLRSNLDPTETVEDAVLWSALRRSQILREDSDLSLDSHVASGGSNFSQGNPVFNYVCVRLCSCIDFASWCRSAAVAIAVTRHGADFQTSHPRRG